MKKRNIAIFAALTLLCGCSGNTESALSQPESIPAAAVEEYTQEASKGSYSAPDYTRSSHNAGFPWWFIPRTTTEITPDAPIEITPYTPTETTSGTPTEICEEPAAAEPQEDPGSVSVALTQEDLSGNNLIFELNGEWCGISDLKAKLTEFTPPEDLSEYEIFDHCQGYIFFRNSPEMDNYSVKCWDMQAGTVKEIYSGENTPLAANDNYLALKEDNTIIVIGTSNGRTVATIPEENGRQYCSNSMCIIYDTLYFDGRMVLDQWNQEFPATFTCDLITGKIKLYKIGARYPHHGVSNVVMDVYDTADTVFDLRGNYCSDVDYKSYFYIKESWTTNGNEQISFIDKDNTEHILGNTSPNYTHKKAVIQRDGVFLSILYGSSAKAYKYIIGRYDLESDKLTAAIYDVQKKLDDIDVIFENDRIIFVDLNPAAGVKYSCTVITPAK